MTATPDAWREFMASRAEYPQTNIRLTPEHHAALTEMAEALGVQPSTLARIIIGMVVTGRTVSRVSLRSDARQK